MYWYEHKRQVPEKGGQKKVSDMAEPGKQVVKSLLIQLLEINLGLLQELYLHLTGAIFPAHRNLILIFEWRLSKICYLC